MSEIINGVGRVGIRNFVPSNSNTFPTSNLFAYSFRKVVPTATLSCRVRRSSDNAEQNIGFVGNDLDTASLSAFVGAGNGFITTIYEQNGSGKNLTQISATRQFQIVASGVINTLNGKPSCITIGRYMYNTAILFSPVTGASIFSVTKLITQLGGEFNVDFIYSIGTGNVSQSDRFLDVVTGGAAGAPSTYVQSLQQGLSSISTPYTSGTKLQSHLIKSGNNKYYQNSVLVGSDTTSLVTPVINQILVVNSTSWSSGGITANRYFSEILIYNSDETSNLTNIQNNINTYYSIYETAPAYTARTTAFAAATGITDATILNALNTFDTGLISNGLDTKMKALYPFVGGTAATHKFNFMDARDVDAAFRLQFNGGWVHSSTGAKPNGINGYANTYLSPYTQLSVGSRHLSMYASDNSQANQYSIDMGAYDSAGQKSNHLSIRRTADNVVGQLNNWGNQSLTSTNNSTGLLLINRPSISSSKAFKNNVLIASTTNDITGQVMPNFNIFLGTSNDNGTAGGSVMSSRGFSLSSIGSGLSDAESATFYNLVQAFQTSLSRAV